jgi:beta-N-acetylhexosaminidase
MNGQGRSVYKLFYILLLFAGITGSVMPVPREDVEGRLKARRIAEGLSSAELAGQVIMSGIDAAGALDASERRRLGSVKPGAIMLFRKNLQINKNSIRKMTDDIILACAGVRPFIALDHEGGAVRRFTDDVEKLPSPFFYWNLARTGGGSAALKKIEEDAERSAREIAALGISMNLAPVVEVLDDDNNSFLGERSYGADTDWVCQASIAFINGMHRGNIACVIKHFPGNSGVDPHKKLPHLRGTASDLERRVLPFYEVIAKAAPSGVMISHIIAEAWDSERNASLSSIVIGEKLVTQSAFAGLVLADDFSMGAVSSSLTAEDSCIAALNAGCDMVMAWPSNLYTIHSAILSALHNGKLPRARLVDAATRIIEQKLRFSMVAAPPRLD